MKLRAKLLLLALLSVVSCTYIDSGRDPTDPEEETIPTSMEIQPERADLAYLGETTVFAAVVRDQNGDVIPSAQVTWSVDNDSVATVNPNGTVKAVSNGSAMVEARFQILSATATVAVEQVATVLEVASGTQQRGSTGRKLYEPIVVLALDQGGSGVPGAEVTFSPADPADGWVSRPVSSADADGLASTAWVLGPLGGTQTLQAALASGEQAAITAVGYETGWPIFRIDLVTDSLTRQEEDWVRSAAAKWESVLTGGLGPMELRDDADATECEVVSRTFEQGHAVDDVELYVKPLEDPDYIYIIDYCWVRFGSWVPIIAGLAINFPSLQEEFPHEIVPLVTQAMGVILGQYGWANERRGLVENLSSDWLSGTPGADSHFTGELALSAFEGVGGADYAGKKVPLRNDGRFGSDAFWRPEVFGDELMSGTYGGRRPLSRVTVQAFADFGYEVNVGAADAYTLPNPDVAAARAADPVREIAVGYSDGPTYVASPDGRIVYVLHPGSQGRRP